MKSAAKSAHRFVSLPSTLKRGDLESKHQAFVVKWLRNRRLLFTAPGNGHFSNVRSRSKATAQGMQRGVPDLLIFEPRHNFTGLAIEMKRPKPYASMLSYDQLEYHRRLRLNGWAVYTCYGAQEALDLLMWYFDAPSHLQDDCEEREDDAAASI